MLFLKKKNAFSLVCVVVFRVTCVLFSGILSAKINKEIKFFIIDSMFIIVVVFYCHEEACKHAFSCTTDPNQQFLWQVFSPKLHRVE